ncbi:MAG: PDZ domain-containing protein [Planctomycetota bacterium]
MRTILVLTLVSFLLPEVRAQDAANEEVVKAVRALMSAKKTKERDELKEKLLARTDLDWTSVKEGLMAGPYHQKPMVTEYGIRHSGKNMGMRFRGKDGKMRGFSVYVPKGYDAKTRIPVLFYLHHNPTNSINAGAGKADIAIRKFRKACEDHNVLFVAPYTGEGAPWWSEGGLDLIDWTLRKVKERYNLDEDKIGLVGTLDAADAIWYVAQNRPGVWNVLVPLSGDPYEVTAIIQPIYLGTLDRMDVLMGVPGQLRTSLGDRNVNSFLDGLKAHFDKTMRLTLAVHPTSRSDAFYIDKMRNQIMSFITDDERKRKPLALEVDIESDAEAGLRSLWLRAQGHDGDIKPPPRFPSTRLVWTPPKKQAEPPKRLGVNLENREWPIGRVITRANLGAQAAWILGGDVLLEVEGTPVDKKTDIAKILQAKNWGDEAELVLAREVTADELPKAEKRQREYMQARAAAAKLRAEGKPVPPLEDLVVDEEEAAEEEDDDEESTIDFGDGDDDEKEDEPKAGKRKETSWFVFRRWVRLVRPEGVLIRQDFGASWDRNYEPRAGMPLGVRVGRVVKGSLAERSGLKAGDVIEQVLGKQVKKMADLREAFADWKFEKEPEGQRSVSFDIKRQTSDRRWIEESVSVSWDPPKPYRVDAKWNKRDVRLDVWVRHGSKATIYFTDELIEPGKEYYLYINNVPYMDLAQPDGRPDYPRLGRGAGPGARERLRKMQRARAKMEGWKFDPKVAIEDALALRDRSLIMGAKLELDFSQMKAGFESSRKRGGQPQRKRGTKLKGSYDEFKAKSQ